jgi:hypothetical protein
VPIQASWTQFTVTKTFQEILRQNYKHVKAVEVSLGVMVHPQLDRLAGSSQNPRNANADQT